jgi:serine/arginine repetitive matrix protein 2
LKPSDAYAWHYLTTSQRTSHTHQPSRWASQKRVTSPVFLFLFATSNYIPRVDEADIEKQVDKLRQKLLASLPSTPQSLKPTDTHGMAAAKKIEVARMARALGTRLDYQEGDAFDREKQELNKLKRIAEREDREKRRADDEARMAEQKAKWELEKRERDILRKKEDEVVR